MNREEIKRYVGITGYSLGQVEKDYFQHIILSGISRKMASKLVFKGGTALQKLGIISRFSEDLDFTAIAPISLSSLQDMILRTLQAYNYTAEIDNIRDEERSSGFRVKIQGPLHRDGKGLCTIRVDISKREEVLLPAQNRVLSPVYFDILPYPIEIMHNEEIAAEKIRAIFTRNRARDIYDLSGLIDIGTEIRADIVEKKLDYYGIKFDMEEFLEKSEESSAKWEKELIGLMEYVPPKEELIEKIKEAIRG